MSGNEAEDYAEGNVETGVGAAMIALSIIVVAMRFYARTHFKAGLGWDDWLAMVALVGTVTAALLVLSGAYRDTASIIDPNSDWIEDNTDPNYHYTAANEKHLLLAWIASIIYFTCVSAAKISILLLYRRIFSTSRTFQRQIDVLNTAIVLFWIATTFATIFTCWPMKWSYISSLSPEPYCFNFNIYWFATGIIEAVFDICIILLPVKMVMKLQMSMRKRVSLVAVFSLGAFGIITGIVKVYQGYAPGKRSPNWNQTETWSAVHGGMGIICSCLPVCWPIVLRFSSKVASTASLPRSRRSTGTGSVRSWWRNHKPSYSWASSGTKETSRREREERGGYIRQPSHDTLQQSETELSILPARLPTAQEPGPTQWDIPHLTIWSDGSNTGSGSNDREKHGNFVDISHSRSSEDRT